LRAMMSDANVMQTSSIAMRPLATFINFGEMPVLTLPHRAYFTCGLKCGPGCGMSASSNGFTFESSP
jgi:hypothetical protein